MESIRKQIRQHIFKLMESNYPVGAEFRSDAPWNQEDPEYNEPEGKEEPFQGLYNNNDFCILRNITDNSLWVYYFNSMMNKENAFRPYALSDKNTGEYNLTPDVIGRYVSDNLNSLKTGIGVDAWEDGLDLVKIDTELSRKLRNDYKDEKLNNILLALS